MADWSHNVINNSEEYREFAHTLGYAILNCGVIEFVTYSYAATLTGGNVFGTGLAQSPFSERRIRIQDLLV